MEKKNKGKKKLPNKEKHKGAEYTHTPNKLIRYLKK